jgi:hypothetical protein
MALLTPEQLHETPSRIFVPFQLTERESAGFAVQPVIKKYDLVYKPEALRQAIQNGLKDMKPDDQLLLNSQRDYILAETVATLLQRMSRVRCICYRFPEIYEEVDIGGS